MVEKIKDLEELRASIEKQGLDFNTVRDHQKKLKGALQLDSKPLFTIVDTCRPDNGGILTKRPAVTSSSDQLRRDVVAFVPAAGAASRYYKPLIPLIDALEASDRIAVEAALCHLKDQGAMDWPLPDRLRNLLENPATARRLSDAGLQDVLEDLHLPKALLPCVLEGVSFLSLKDVEHSRIKKLIGQVYITPPGEQNSFRANLEESRRFFEANAPDARSIQGRPLPSIFLEQGPALSTIRFHPDGSPWTDDEGNVSLVPAGHGTLAQLFPKVKERFSDAKSLFIRNIDNVMGIVSDALAATETFLETHSILLDLMERIRRSLDENDVDEAASAAAPLVESLPSTAKIPWHDEADRFLASRDDSPIRTLWMLQMGLFHTRPPAEREKAAAAKDLEILRQLYSRPLNTMGQVSNISHDVGGTPCFIKNPKNGRKSKVCIEVPHVSEADKIGFLANHEKATHFNPVFVAAEITTQTDYYSSQNEDFWLIAEKSFGEDQVIYFETVLYELLGNSNFANVLFVEIPRLVFHPHKSLQDGARRHLRDWLP